MVAILDFNKICENIEWVRKAETHHRAKFRQNSLIR